MTTIINDNLIITALNMLSLLITLIATGLGAGIGFIGNALTGHSSLILAGSILGAIIGLLTGFILSAALDNAVVMVYVCFAEDPNILQVLISLLHYFYSLIILILDYSSKPIRCITVQLGAISTYNNGFPSHSKYY